MNPLIHRSLQAHHDSLVNHKSQALTVNSNLHHDP